MTSRVGFSLGLIVGASTSYLVERISARIGRWWDATHIDLTRLTD